MTAGEFGGFFVLLYFSHFPTYQELHGMAFQCVVTAQQRHLTKLQVYNYSAIKLDQYLSGMKIVKWMNRYRRYHDGEYSQQDMRYYRQVSI